MVWVTYKEDKEVVLNLFKELIDSGVYKEYLFSDIIKDTRDCITK